MGMRMRRSYEYNWKKRPAIDEGAILSGLNPKLNTDKHGEIKDMIVVPAIMRFRKDIKQMVDRPYLVTRAQSQHIDTCIKVELHGTYRQQGNTCDAPIIASPAFDEVGSQ